MKNIFRNALVIVASFVFVITIVNAAWTGPSVNPPDGNVAAPVNVDVGNQIKAGGLGVASLLVTGKAISASTVDGDLGGTLVTKDYLDAKIALGGGGSTGDNLGNHSATQNIDMNGSQVTNLGTPVNATDAVTKGYMDSSIRSGKVNVYWTNGVERSSLGHVTFSPACQNPVIFTQSNHDSIKCGNGSGIINCPNAPSSNSQDLKSYPINISQNGFDALLSGDSGAWVGASSPAYPVSWIAMCN